MRHCSEPAGFWTVTMILSPSWHCDMVNYMPMVPLQVLRLGPDCSSQERSGHRDRGRLEIQFTDTQRHRGRAGTKLTPAQHRMDVIMIANQKVI